VIPREVGDNPHGPPPCNIHAYPDPYSINSFIGVFERNNPGYNIRRLGIIEILRALLHNVYIIRGWVPVQYTPQVNEELRIQYMINITPAEVYKKELQKREKDRNKKRDMTDILSMFETVSREIMHKIWRETIPRKIEEYVAELQTLREYANDNMKLVSKRYKCIYPHMNEQFIMVSSRA
jgi:2-phosphoglycerate kinase